jgi:hypothetical protein
VIPAGIDPERGRAVAAAPVGTGDVMSMIERLTAWYWGTLHTAVVQRAEGTCGGIRRTLPRNAGFDYSDGPGTDPAGGGTDAGRPRHDD